MSDAAAQVRRLLDEMPGGAELVAFLPKIAEAELGRRSLHCCAAVAIDSGVTLRFRAGQSTMRGRRWATGLGAVGGFLKVGAEGFYDVATDEQARKVAWDAAVQAAHLPTLQQALGAGELVAGGLGTAAGYVITASGAAMVAASIATTPEGIGIPINAAGLGIASGGVALTGASIALAAKGWDDLTSSNPPLVSPSDQTGSPTGPTSSIGRPA